MILRINIENWASFRNSTEFSMIASRERQHGHRLSKIQKHQLRVLPIAAIYGGNASGKTNFFLALKFAKGLVVRGTQPDSQIPVESYRLFPDDKTRPTRFTFEILIDEKIYEYSFVVTRKAVLEEKLSQITRSSEKTLYSRKNGEIDFGTRSGNDLFLRFAFRGTRDNQLFLTNSVSQKVDDYRPVYDWFKNQLEFIAPDTRFEPFEKFLDDSDPLYATMTEMLLQLDTAIVRIGGKETPIENISLPEPIITQLQEELGEGGAARIRLEPGNERYVVTENDGELTVKKLGTFHKKEDGTEVPFDMRHESDGSQRIIDLLPAFLELSASRSKKVYVIDEVDRSLHTLVLRRLLEAYLDNCSPENRAQLLLTTHDVLLMDQSLLRRDEMWVAERDSVGASTLLSFSEYRDVRYDKDIRRSYLQGRLGGIPRILFLGTTSDVSAKKDAGSV